jgi:hypothetical protein
MTSSGNRTKAVALATGMIPPNEQWNDLARS